MTQFPHATGSTKRRYTRDEALEAVLLVSAECHECALTHRNRRGPGCRFIVYTDGNYTVNIHCTAVRASGRRRASLSNRFHRTDGARKQNKTKNGTISFDAPLTCAIMLLHRQIVRFYVKTTSRLFPNNCFDVKGSSKTTLNVVKEKKPINNKMKK